MGAVSKENNKQERTDYKNETPNSDENPEDQSDQIVKTLLGSDPYIVKHKYCEDNFLIT